MESSIDLGGMVDSTYSFKEIMQGIYSLIDVDDWDELPGTNNPVESINRQSTPTNVKSVSLKPLLEHFYFVEDCRQAALQVAAEAGVTISYWTKKQRRTRRPSKTPESRLAIVPSGKKSVGLTVSIEFYENDQETTHWYKGSYCYILLKKGIHYNL